MSESSPENDGVLVSPDTTNTDVDTAAASSTEAKQGVEKSPSDLVFEALGLNSKEKSPDSEQDQTDPADPKSEEAAKTADADAAPKPLGEITPEEMKRYTPKTQERIQQLLDQRLEKHNEVEALKPKAQQFEALEEYAATNKLSMPQIAESVELAALVNQKPEEALQRLIPVIQHLMKVTGQVLPDDIQERVRLGYMGEEDARKLVKAEITAQRASETAAETARDLAAREQANEIRELQRTATEAADKWESSRKRSDPDWPLKSQRVGELIELEVLKKGFPSDQTAVVRMLDVIADKVNAEYARFTPRPKEIRPVTGTASTAANSEPKSSKEAALRALGFDL